MTKVSLPLFRTKETEAWRGTKQVYESMVKTQCLAVQSQALSYCALYLSIVMTHNNPDHVEPLLNACPGQVSLVDWNSKHTHLKLSVTTALGYKFRDWGGENIGRSHVHIIF